MCRRRRGADRPGRRASVRCGPGWHVECRRVRIRPARWASTKRQPRRRLGFRGGEGEREGRNEGERFREGDLSGAGVARLAGGPSNEIRAGEIKKMKLEREVSSGRGWEDIWLAAEREMAHWQVAPVLKLELDSFKQHFQILNDFKLKSHQLDNCITHQNLQLSFLAFLRLSLF